MTRPSDAALLVVLYAVFLLGVAYGFDRLARRTSVRAARWRTGSFTYHRDHDAWLCPQEQWLWPQSFDPDQRVMRYRAKPTVCNACPVKQTCTSSTQGREITREVDPWPHSEAGRFHRGIACCIALLAVALPAGMLFSRPRLTDTLLLLASVAVAVLAGIPLARHLWRTPSGFPEEVPHVRAGASPAPADRFATRWGSFRVTDVSGSSRLRGNEDKRNGS
ncbi:MAG: hypothetical protein ABI083_04665 [Lapillicoccus sp.]